MESVTEAREKLGLELLVDRRKAAHIYLLIKIIGDDRHSLLMDRFDSLYKDPTRITQDQLHLIIIPVLCPPIKLFI